MSSPVQTPATFRQDGEVFDYTPSGAVTAGDIIVIAGRVYVAESDIPANTLGSLATCGVFRCPKDASVFSGGDPVYWNASGSPLSPGVANSGCCTSTSLGNVLMGFVPIASPQLTGDLTVDVKLLPAGGTDGQGSGRTATVAATGSTQTDAAQIGTGFTLVTGANATVGVKLPPATAGATCTVKNSDAANAVLKVWPSGTDTINAIAASTNIAMAAKTCCEFKALAGAWYTLPLLPS